jgi:hypothetical protein
MALLELSEGKGGNPPPGAELPESGVPVKGALEAPLSVGNGGKPVGAEVFAEEVFSAGSGGSPPLVSAGAATEG